MKSDQAPEEGIVFQPPSFRGGQRGYVSFRGWNWGRLVDGHLLTALGGKLIAALPQNLNHHVRALAPKKSAQLFNSNIQISTNLNKTILEKTGWRKRSSNLHTWRLDSLLLGPVWRKGGATGITNKAVLKMLAILVTFPSILAGYQGFWQ